MATAHSSGDEPPETGAAPSLGLVLAGVALAASFLPWTGQPPLVEGVGVPGSLVSAGLALIATVAFALRRHGALARRVGAPIAGLFCLSVTGVGLYRLVVPAVGSGGAPTVEFGLPIATLAGLFGAGVAVADWRAVTDTLLWEQVRAVGASLVLGFLGFVVSTAIAYGVVAIPLALDPGFGLGEAFPILTAGSGIGLGLFALGYLRYRDLELDYIDVHWPDRYDVGYSVAGLIVIFLAAGLVAFGFQELGLPTTESSIEQLASDINPAFLLALVPLSWLAIGPGEELVYRNVVQKYLYESFSERTSVVIASVGFAAVHFQQYASPNPVAMLSTLFLVFVLSLVLGYTYYKSENLLVPIFIHGTFNAIQFLGLYFRLTGDVPAA